MTPLPFLPPSLSSFLPSIESKAKANRFTEASCTSASCWMLKARSVRIPCAVENLCRTIKWRCPPAYCVPIFVGAWARRFPTGPEHQQQTDIRTTSTSNYHPAWDLGPGSSDHVLKTLRSTPALQAPSIYYCWQLYEERGTNKKCGSVWLRFPIFPFALLRVKTGGSPVPLSLSLFWLGA